MLELIKFKIKLLHIKNNNLKPKYIKIVVKIIQKEDKEMSLKGYREILPKLSKRYFPKV